MHTTDKKRYTALMHAAAQGGHEQAEQVKLMVDAGADYNMKGTRARVCVCVCVCVCVWTRAVVAVATVAIGVVAFFA